MEEERVLYWDKISQPARAVMSLLEVAGISDSVKQVEVQVSTGDIKKPAFKAINPNMKLPAYSEGEQVMFESAAILRFIANKYLPADSHWYPRTNPVICARINEELEFYHRLLRTSTRLIYAIFLAPLVGVEHLFDIKNETDKVYALCQLVEKKLEGKLFVVLDEPTIADLLIFQEIIQLFMIDTFELETAIYPNLRPYLIRMLKRLGPASKTMAPFVDIIKETTIIKELL